MLGIPFKCILLLNVKKRKRYFSWKDSQATPVITDHYTENFNFLVSKSRSEIRDIRSINWSIDNVMWKTYWEEVSEEKSASPVTFNTHSLTPTHTFVFLCVTITTIIIIITTTDDYDDEVESTTITATGVGVDLWLCTWRKNLCWQIFCESLRNSSISSSDGLGPLRTNQQCAQLSRAAAISSEASEVSTKWSDRVWEGK